MTDVRGRDLSKVAAAAVAILLGLIGPATAQDSECWVYKKGDHRLARSINRLRANHELRRLSLDPELSRVARKHTREMIAARSRFHSSARALRYRVTRWEILGENIGTAPTVESLIREMRTRGENRDNLLHGPFRHFGVSIKWAHGRVWGTVLLEARLDPGTRLPMPDC